MAYAAPTGNITSFSDFFSYINTSIENLFFVGVIVAIYFVMLIRMMYTSQNNSQAFAAASFICMILTILLRVANLVNTSFMVIFIILTAIGGVWMQIENAKN